MHLSEFNRSPLLLTVVLAVAFVIVVAVVFIFRPSGDATAPPITSVQSAPVEPSAENVDPTFHSRLMVLTREVAEAPTDTTKLLELAHLHQDAHQMEEAAEAYERLLRVAPDHRQARLDLALSYAELGRWEEAETATRTLLERFPDDAAGLYNLGAIHANQNDFESAREIWERLLATSEDADMMQQASTSLAQLDNLSRQQATPSSTSPAPLPSNHPPISPSEYEPVIAGQ